MQANFLGTIHSNVERMSTLVSDLNDNSKIEAGRLRLDFKAVDIAEVVDEVMRSTKRQMEDKKQTAAMNICRQSCPRSGLTAPAWRRSSPTWSAMPTSTRRKAGSSPWPPRRVHNQWDPEGAAEVVHIWVQDTGIGISLEDQKKIFQKFFRSEDSKAREAPGTGLGLNITKSLIEMMGGRIWFEVRVPPGDDISLHRPDGPGIRAADHEHFCTELPILGRYSNRGRTHDPSCCSWTGTCPGWA